MKEPVIVTAFWDVGRSKDCAIPRTNDRYLSEFSEWARIENELIVFCDDSLSDKILSIRSKYNLKEKTRVIKTSNFFDIEQDIYRRMVQIEKKDTTRQFKYIEEAMSNRANFDYAWLMKYWCISEASKIVEQEDLIAWMDFGFNHMNNCYTNMEEFAFLWKTDLNTDKIHLFSLMDVSSISTLDTLQLQFDTIMGVFHVIPAKYALHFWQLIKQACYSLLMCECLDDDQQLLLMAYKYEPELFEIHKSDWFLPLKECGASGLTVRQKKDNGNKGWVSKMLNNWRQEKKAIKFAIKAYKRVKKYY